MFYLVSPCREIMHVGLPAVASNMIMPVSMSIITRLLAGHGAVIVAGFGVASRIESALVMVIRATPMSIAPLIGQNWGAGKFDRVRQAMKISSIFVLSWGAASYLLLAMLDDYFVGLINGDPEMIDAAYTYLLVAPISVGFMGLMSISTSTFNALGKPMPPLILSVLQMLVINIPLALLGNYLLGYVGIIIGGVVTTVLLGAAAWLWIRRTIEQGVDRALVISG